MQAEWPKSNRFDSHDRTREPRRGFPDRNRLPFALLVMLFPQEGRGYGCIVKIQRVKNGAGFVKSLVRCLVRQKKLLRPERGRRQPGKNVQSRLHPARFRQWRPFYGKYMSNTGSWLSQVLRSIFLIPQVLLGNPNADSRHRLIRQLVIVKCIYWRPVKRYLLIGNVVLKWDNWY